MKFENLIVLPANERNREKDCKVFRYTMLFFQIIIKF
jgi:hypothetical protein